MVVYLDVIWFLNLLADSLLLWTTAIFLKRKVKVWRMLCGGMIGSSLILLAITPYASAAAHPLTKVVISILMVVAAFGFKRMRFFMSALLTFYFATFLMGGILLGAHYFLKFDFQLHTAVTMESIRGYGDPVSWAFVAIALPAAWHFSRKRIEDLTLLSLSNEKLATVVISINGLELAMNGLIDSGNQLYDPITKTPVMIVSTLGLKEQLPHEICSLAGENTQMFEAVEELTSDWRDRMRLVPAKSLGKNHQLLCAFKPDSIIVCVNDEKKEVSKALIAFTEQELSGDQQFDCIIHPAMVELAFELPAS